jgi:hypothetical protein
VNGNRTYKKRPQRRKLLRDCERPQGIRGPVGLPVVNVLLQYELALLEQFPPAFPLRIGREREFVIRYLDRDPKGFRRVRQALSRIADGSYGVCLHCEEDILPKRSPQCHGLPSVSDARN